MKDIRINKAGELEGVVTRSWSTTNKAKEVVEVSLNINLKGVTLERVVNLALGAKIIQRQAQERKVSKELVKSFNNTTIPFKLLGAKIVDPEEVKRRTKEIVKAMTQEERANLIEMLLEVK